MNKSRPESEVKDKLIKFPKALWEEMEGRAAVEQFPNMNEFVRHVCREYLKTSGFSGQIHPDSELKELLSRREELEKREYEFVANLNSLLKSAKSGDRPKEYHQKIADILSAVKISKLKFDEIYDQTQIPKEELIVLIGNLIENEEIGFDENWRYFRR